MATPIFTPEDIITYAETRLFGLNVRPGDVGTIELHNAVLPSELEGLLARQGRGDFVRVAQDNGREPIFFHDGTLYIPQYSGTGRRRRYEDMVDAYNGVTEKRMDFKSLEREQNPLRTDIFYENFAYDFVKAFSFSDDARGVRTVIIGPISGFKKMTDIVRERTSEYLSSQILDAGGKLALNMCYVYADQAGIILTKLLRDYQARAREDKTNTAVDIYIMGRVGCLAEGFSRHDIICPTGILDEINLAEGSSRMHGIANVLHDSGQVRGGNLNVQSVIGETREKLEDARKAGCICTDMELSEAAAAIESAGRRYRKYLTVRFGFVGHVSDLPLQGDTLATELDSDLGEQRAVKRIVDYIKEHG